ncbi:DUF2867 domain-containing protein [Halomonas sp.]|uniref:DUF2867 domain-containing protein n=1 Tax=Halomonas sp. TaxID=1486246 RepID=UPI00384BB91E
METPHKDYRHYPLHAGSTAHTRAPAEAVWQVVSAIGGNNRYYTLNGLWAMREWLDAVVGGPGRRRGRPEGRPIRAGDQIDSWRVSIAAAPELLALEFGMKAPGHGVLEFRVAPIGDCARVTATAFWNPEGIAGQLYWAAMKPAHLVLFKRLTAEICRRAEQASHDGKRSTNPIF